MIIIITRRTVRIYKRHNAVPFPFSAAAPFPHFRTCRPCRGLTHRATARPTLRRHFVPPTYGVNKLPPLRVSASKSILPEIRHKFDVASRLAIFAVKKLCRFEREETRAVRSNANGVSGASFRVLARNGQF